MDATVGYERMSFLGAYSGYNQIKLNERDRIHTAFITKRGLYCYKVMAFGLNNVGAIYQRLINQMFSEHIREKGQSLHRRYGDQEKKIEGPRERYGGDF